MKNPWILPSSLLAFSLVPAIAGTARLAELASGAEITAHNARFFDSPLPVLIHIPAVIVFSMLGAFQFSPSFRRSHRKWHRTAGRILIPAGLLAALSGLWMAHFYAWPAGDGMMVYLERLIAGTAMLASIVLSINSIRRRDFVTHGHWMLRAYAIGLGAGTQVFTHLPWFIFVDGAPGELPRGLMMGSAWAINMMVAEWIIRRERSPQRASATALQIA